jgi:formate hydrogenlyase transcriptional activator
MSDSAARHTDAEVDAFKAIVEGTARSTGQDFFRSLVRNLSLATGVNYAFVGEFVDRNSRVRTVAYWRNGEFVDHREWPLQGSACEAVLNGGFCHFPTGVSERFPVDAGFESYLGVPLKDASGKVLGHLAILDTRPMPEQPRLISIFQIFASRAAAEMERLATIRMLEQSEQRFRDLFEQAPIAYVHETLDSRFLSANAAAQRILGLQAHEVEGTFGRSFVPATDDALQRFNQAFAAVGKGTDTNGVVLELRRRHNGEPLWVQWWSRPDPSGEFTRTMFIDITDKVLLERERARLKAENQYLQEELQSVHNFQEIIGRSPAMQSVLGDVRRVAATDASVLIRGETGTGKELIARAIHSASKRHEKPLIKVNCAALPTGLVESELFGHEKGAFTGALSRRIGRFELASGGTIFLDEIGEMPMDVQAKLLRVLQEREFERVGGQTSIQVDVRVIAATNRDLQKAIAEKTFREDLFYRLNVFPIHLPPLRERTGDLPILAQFLVEKFAMRIGRSADSLSPDSLERLEKYDWPGNIRELENVIERAVILSDGPQVRIPAGMLPEALPPSAETNNPTPHAATADGSDLLSVERSHIESVLQQTNWVIEGPRGAAQRLGLHPNTLRSRLKKLGLKRHEP